MVSSIVRAFNIRVHEIDTLPNTFEHFAVPRVSLSKDEKVEGCESFTEFPYADLKFFRGHWRLPIDGELWQGRTPVLEP